jgi:nicotinate-nucleotide pyrophosphorylase (carboxylating)
MNTSQLDNSTLEMIDRALVEDAAGFDYTSLWTVPEDFRTRAVLWSKADGILCGADLFAQTFRRVDPGVQVDFLNADGDTLAPGQEVARLMGLGRSLLSAERTALNFLGRLTGIATLTARYVKEVEGTGAAVCDTRKTLPLYRAWDKYAVRTGGGTNHRFNLSDMILLKDNHVRLAGGPAEALRRIKQSNRIGLPVEIEVETLEELREALAEQVDRILLDNMNLDQLREAVRITEGQAKLEASGGVNLGSLRAIAETGVDYVSVGALTHSVSCFDFSLEIA